MKYFATWWERDNGKTYAQVFDERPNDEFEFEGNKNDYYCGEFNPSDIRSDYGNVTGYPDDEKENESFSRLINELQSGTKIILDNYYEGK